jgi:hypothetical protein
MENVRKEQEYIMYCEQSIQKENAFIYICLFSIF